MEQQVSRWIPLAVALTAGIAILLRNAYSSKERRSPGQWFIFRLYKVMRLVWAVIRGVDIGYLEYRRVLQQSTIEIENERHLGKLVKVRAEEPALGYAVEQQA